MNATDNIQAHKLAQWYKAICRAQRKRQCKNLGIGQQPPATGKAEL